MTFDEQLRRALDTLADRLRGEAARHLAEVSAELSAAIEVERAAAAAQAAEAATASTAKEMSARAAKAEALAEQRGREAGHREGFDAGRQEGLVAGREQGSIAGREEGLAAGREEARSAAREEVLGHLAADGRLVDAIRAIDHARSLSEILDALASAAGREAARAGVLLVRGGRLRGWRFIGFGAPLDAAPDVEFPLDGSGVVAEAVRTGVAASADGASTAGAPPFAKAPLGRDALALPVPMSGQIIAVLYADQSSDPPGGAGAPAAWRATLEIMARHAARCLEAITAFRTAKVFSDMPSAAGMADAPPEPSPRSADDEEQAARRYARLLVSEIKMYHEPAVIAGRQERNLAARLGGEIARARVLYEQRVPADVRRATDYFHAELVRTLADGDASLLEARA